MTEMTEQYRIIAGPSREELFDALRLRHEGRTVTFTLKGPYSDSPRREVSVFIDAIGVEDGSGNRFLVEIFHKGSFQRFKGYFDITHRRGQISPH